MRGKLASLMVIGALLAGCSSQGTIGSAASSASSLPGAAGISAAPSSGSSSSGSSSPGSPSSGSVPGKDATVILGVGKTKVTLYEDYRCPPCKNIHDDLRPVLTAQLAAGRIKVEFHAVDLVDHNSGGKGSLAAGNAAGCAFQLGKFQPYNDALFAAQPDESDDAFAQQARLISIAQSVPDLDGPAFEQCLSTQPYAASIESTYNAEIASNKLTGVPAVFINGTPWSVPTAPTDVAAAFTQALSAAED